MNDSGKIGFDRQDNRSMEREYFNSFSYFERSLQSRKINQCEAPDFLIEFDNYVLGIEIRKIFGPQQGQQIESNKDRILKEALLIAQERGLPSADVTLFFNLDRSVTKKIRRGIAESIVRLIADQMPDDGKYIEIAGAPGQPRQVDLIIINRIGRLGGGRWIWLEFAGIGEDASCVVQAAVNDKGRKLVAYLKKCDVCWLLLVADSFKPSGKLALDRICRETQFFSPFDRTYVLDFGRGKLYELLTKKA